MKKFIIIYLIMIALIACNQQPSEPVTFKESIIGQDSIKNKPLEEYFSKQRTSKGVKVKIQDEWVDKNIGFYIFFYLVNGKPTKLIFHIQYPEQKVFQFSVNGSKYTYKSNFSKGKGDNEISWYEYDLRPTDIRLFYNLNNSASEPHIIFSDGTMTTVDQDLIENIKKTLQYFEKLGGKRPSMISLPYEKAK